MRTTKLLHSVWLICINTTRERLLYKIILKLVKLKGGVGRGQSFRLDLFIVFNFYSEYV